MRATSFCFTSSPLIEAGGKKITDEFTTHLLSKCSMIKRSKKGALLAIDAALKSERLQPEPC